MQFEQCCLIRIFTVVKKKSSDTTFEAYMLGLYQQHPFTAANLKRTIYKNAKISKKSIQPFQK